jgi:hypothetical protein
MAPSVLGDGLWLSGGTKCFFFICSTKDEA